MATHKAKGVIAMSKVVVLHDDAVSVVQAQLPLESRKVSRKHVEDFLRQAHKESKKDDEFKSLISRYMWPCVLLEAGLFRRGGGPSSSVASISAILPVMNGQGDLVVVTVHGPNLAFKCVPSRGLIEASAVGLSGGVVVSAAPENARKGLRIELKPVEEGFGLALLFGKDTDAFAPQDISTLVSISMQGRDISAEIGNPPFEEAAMLVAAHPNQDGIVLYFAPKAEIGSWIPG
jgi:hypothetical protein